MCRVCRHSSNQANNHPNRATEKLIWRLQNVGTWNLFNIIYWFIVVSILSFADNKNKSWGNSKEKKASYNNYKNKNKKIHYAPHTLSTGARKMETPVRTNTSMPVTLCSLYVWHWRDTRERQVSFTMHSSTSATKDLGQWFCSSAMSVVAAYLTNCTFLFISELFVFTLPDPEELRLLSWSTRFTLHLQRVDVSNRDDGGSHVPGQTQEGACGHQDSNPEQIQVIATAFLQGKQRSFLLKATS